MSFPAWAEIPIYMAGVFSLINWYAPDLAAAATELSPLTAVLVVALTAGVLVLRDLLPALIDAS